MTETALLEAIRAAPDDDAPRHVYADWLQTRGDPRGEFIALQLREYREHQTGHSRPSETLRRAHGDAWAPVLPEGVEALGFERGFLTRVRLLAPRSDWPGVLGELAKLSPVPEEFALAEETYGFGAISIDGRWVASVEAPLIESDGYSVVATGTAVVRRLPSLEEVATFRMGWGVGSTDWERYSATRPSLRFNVQCDAVVAVDDSRRRTFALTP